MEKDNNKEHKKKNLIRLIATFSIIVITIILLLCGSWIYMKSKVDSVEVSSGTNEQDQISGDPKDDPKDEELTQVEIEEKAEQERLQKEIKERQDLIAQADRLALGYYYDEALELIKSYKGADGDYTAYIDLMDDFNRLESEKASLKLYGGSYTSVTQINHIFYHSLVADTSKAFDGDSKTKGYNQYMATISEFNKILQKMYDDGYVLVRMSDLVKKETLEDGSEGYTENEIYLREGKKPFVLSQDDVNYYDYMTGDGFASRIVIGEDGKPTCEMLTDDGTSITGAFDVVPLLDDFIDKHPDFSYKGAKGLLAITGYEGVLGYRTNNPDSPTYEEDRDAVKKVVEVLKAEGWEIGSHSWGHRDMQVVSLALLERDTKRWLDEVGSLVGPTDIYVFPFGSDIETTMGHYKSEKFTFLKKSGFNMFLGVYKEPWMHVMKDYIRMTRRPIDGQAMLQFPERLSDLFDVKDIVDTSRPPIDWR